jgi:hypothetical protein
VVELYGVEIDGHAAAALVDLVEATHVAVVEDRVPLAKPGEIHHRIADVGELEVEHGHDSAGVVVELPRVPHHHRLPSSHVDRVPREPPETELEQRIGAALRGAIHALVEGHADPAGVHRVRGSRDARGRERLDRKAVQVSEDLHVVVHDAVALVVANSGEVRPAGRTVHHERTRLVAPAVHARHAHAGVVHQGLRNHLVPQRPDARDVDAFAAHAELEACTIAVDIDEPHRTPSGLALDRDDTSPEVVIDPAPDPTLLRLHMPSH